WCLMFLRGPKGINCRSLKLIYLQDYRPGCMSRMAGQTGRAQTLSRSGAISQTPSPGELCRHAAESRNSEAKYCCTSPDQNRHIRVAFVSSATWLSLTAT